MAPLVERPLSLAVRTLRVLAEIPGYLRAWYRYRRLPAAEPLQLRDADPRLSDRLPATPFDPHYLYQAIWAAERIFANAPSEHVDVGSQLMFVTVLAAKLSVVFVDIRPMQLDVANLRPMAGDILDLPFSDRSIASLSCLHVVEHIGLGRYGDTLNPSGTRQALAELERVLAPGGDLFLSLPVGRPRVCFNAHRIHDPREIVEMLRGLELVEFSAVDDAGRIQAGESVEDAARFRYGCGLFWFRGRR
ncbi:MAG: DUF268 domain-containing protein [Gaiellaceae bacterium]